MSLLHIDLPEELRARLQARAAESGYASIEQYAQAVLQANIGDDFVDDDIESLLIDRLNDSNPPIAFNNAFKDQFRNQIRRRRDSQGK